MYGGKDTLYEVLGINRSASAGEIVGAYRKRRAELTAGTLPAERASLLHEAYEVLSDATRRAAYDAACRLAIPASRAPMRRPEVGLIAPACRGDRVLYLLLRTDGKRRRASRRNARRCLPAIGRVHSSTCGAGDRMGPAFAIEPGAW